MNSAYSLIVELYIRSRLHTGRCWHTSGVARPGGPERALPRAAQGRRVPPVDQLQRLHETGAITRAHHDAARRFLRDAEAADGARPEFEPTGVRMDIALTGPGGIQLLAISRYRRAVQAIGQRGSAILGLVVLENAGISDLVRRLGVRQHYTAVGMLLATLDRLCEHYEAPRREPHAPKQTLEAV